MLKFCFNTVNLRAKFQDQRFVLGDEEHETGCYFHKYVNFFQTYYFSPQTAKVQADDSEHGDQQRERGNGDHGHRPAAGPVPDVRAGPLRLHRAAAARPVRRQQPARPVGRQAVRGGVRHEHLRQEPQQDEGLRQNGRHEDGAEVAAKHLLPVRRRFAGDFSSQFIRSPPARICYETRLGCMKWAGKLQ